MSAASGFTPRTRTAISCSGMSRGSVGLQRLQHDLARRRRVHAQQHVALQPLGLGQRVVVRREPRHVAGDDARLAQAAGAVAAAVVELEPRLEPGLQQRVATLDEELAAAGPARSTWAETTLSMSSMMASGRRSRWRARRRVRARERHGVRAKRGRARRRPASSMRCCSVDDELVVARQVPPRIGEFLALREEPLRQHLAAGSTRSNTRRPNASSFRRATRSNAPESSSRNSG